ncbi:MAG TPA: SPOR domain-containing protein, partial [Chitinophagaceae bacterium]|nr:SPOR domain-containing protein [Chitinophagaceae bacterium]
TTTFMNKIFLIAAVFFSLSAFSQDTSSIIIHKDPRIDLLVKKQIQINEETSRDARRVGRGYRLLVVNTNKRDEAVAAKSKVYTFFPELKSYLIYQSPYFKLKVGNFKDRKEAEEYRERLQKYFPKGVFIMNDTIEIRLDKDKETEVVSRG